MMPRGVDAKKGCDGRFACSDFVQNSDLMNDKGTCIYGHIEDGGTCDTPCEGTRYARCRCKTKEDAEEDVKSAARTKLYISVAIIALALLFFFWQFKKKRTSEMEPEEPEAPVSQPPVVQVIVVQPTVVGDGNVGEDNAPSGSNVDKADVISRSSSRIIVATNKNPNKVRFASGIVLLVFPVMGVVMWVIQVNKSDVAIMDSFKLFIGLAGIIVYFSALLFFVAWHVAKLGLPRVAELLRRNPFFILRFVHNQICLCIPLVFAAGAVWCVNRMSNAEGIYSRC